MVTMLVLFIILFVIWTIALAGNVVAQRAQQRWWENERTTLGELLGDLDAVRDEAQALYDKFFHDAEHFTGLEDLEEQVRLYHDHTVEIANGVVELSAILLQRANG
jgi:uncharacterized membrane protein YecN with MAPEG domain